MPQGSNLGCAGETPISWSKFHNFWDPQSIGQNDCAFMDQNISVLNCHGESKFEDSSIDQVLPINRYTPLVAVTLGCLLLKYIYNATDCDHDKLLPPGTRGWPIIGETVEFLLDGRKYFRSRIEKNGNIFMTHLMGRPAVVVVGASNVRSVLTATESHISPSLPPAALSILGENALCASKGDAHRRLQRAVLKVFTHKGLSSMTPNIQTIIRRFVHKWTEVGDVSKCSKECQKMTFEVANFALLGFDFSDRDNASLMAHFDAISDAFLSFPIYFPGFAYYKGIAARDAVVKMIFQKRNDEKGQSMLDHLFADKTTSKDEITSLALELMFGGNQTIASSLCAALITLHAHPEVVARMREEVHQYCHRYRTSPENLGFEDIHSLTFLGDVSKELLRLKPPIAGGFRKTLQALKVGDYTIPEGFMILYGITDTHETTETFTYATEFRPERWEEMRTTSIKNDNQSASAERSKRFEYLPFGGGRRFCVGKELAKVVIKVFLIELIIHCKWTLANAEPEIRTAPIPFPVDGLPIHFSPITRGDKRQQKTR